MVWRSDRGQPRTGPEEAERPPWVPSGRPNPSGFRVPAGRKPREGQGFGRDSLGAFRVPTPPHPEATRRAPRNRSIRWRFSLGVVVSAKFRLYLFPG